jgi:hypothetical protein
MPAPRATGITASGSITAPAIAPIVSITPAVLTPPPTSIGNTTSMIFLTKGNDYE